MSAWDISRSVFGIRNIIMYYSNIATFWYCGVPWSKIITMWGHFFPCIKHHVLHAHLSNHSPDHSSRRVAGSQWKAQLLVPPQRWLFSNNRKQVCCPCCTTAVCQWLQFLRQFFLTSYSHISYCETCAIKVSSCYQLHCCSYNQSFPNKSFFILWNYKKKTAATTQLVLQSKCSSKHLYP